ncbi:MAG: hypothetical protein V1838_04110 [Patescibacteria group bacterium]
MLKAALLLRHQVEGQRKIIMRFQLIDCSDDRSGQDKDHSTLCRAEVLGHNGILKRIGLSDQSGLWIIVREDRNDRVVTVQPDMKAV